MTHLYVLFCLAVILAQWQSSLFSLPVLLAAVAGAVVVIVLYASRLVRHRLVLSGAVLVLGAGYSQLAGYQALSQRLPVSLEQQDISLQMAVEGYPVDKGRYQQFDARVISSTEASALVGHIIRLNVYGGAVLQPCQQWRATVRLKRPHGLVNPGGFDYQGYLLQQRIVAKGYVRSLQQKVSVSADCQQGLRLRWRQYVTGHWPAANAAWLLALSSGDKSLLSISQRQFLTQTGLAHLFVISGLHIGMAALFAVMVLRLLRRFGLGLCFPGNWQAVNIVAALLAALAYAAFSGWQLPAQRALLMLLAFSLAQWFAYSSSLWTRYFLAMAIVLLVDPLAALSIGFVLSFMAVLALILQWQRSSPQRGIRGWWLTLIKAQVAIFLLLTPISLFYFSTVSWLAPVLNLIAIPVVTLITLPLILAGLLSWLMLGQDLGLLSMADFTLQLLLALVEQILHWSQAFNLVPLWSLSVTPVVATVAVMAAIVWLLPRALAIRGFAMVLLAALVLPQQNHPVREGGVAVDIIDVGQGLSVLVRTANHQLLYDTGASWQGGSMMKLAVEPTLAFYGISSLDKAIISHSDNDHAGGVVELLASYSVEELLSSDQSLPGAKPCVAGAHWRWDGVSFRVLHPQAGVGWSESNNRSCVLLIEAAGRTLLLPGDIEKKVEQTLLLRWPALAIDALLAPHHGSKTSSGRALRSRLSDAAVVIYSTGYLNRFHHPHPLVDQAYREQGATCWNTAESGAIQLRIHANGNMTVNSFRQLQGRYWY